MSMTFGLMAPNITFECKGVVGGIRNLGYPLKEVPRGPFHQATTTS